MPILCPVWSNFVPVNRPPETDRKLALKAHEQVKFCSDPVRSEDYFPEWKPALTQPKTPQTFGKLSILRLVNKLQQACQFPQVATSLLKSGLLQFVICRLGVRTCWDNLQQACSWEVWKINLQQVCWQLGCLPVTSKSHLVSNFANGTQKFQLENTVRSTRFPFPVRLEKTGNIS